MGSEIVCSLKLDGRIFKGKALLETDELVFRGEHQLTIPFRRMKSVDAGDGELTVVFQGGRASFTIEKKAAAWRQKILHPKSLLDKLGVKADSHVSVEGVNEKEFLRLLRAKSEFVSLNGVRKDSDVIFYAADSKKALSKIKTMKHFLKENGALWIVSLKGKQAKLKDAEIMAGGKKAGLVDTKVVSFSSTRTALKFVIPLTNRH